MAAFPYYDTPALDALNSQAAALLGLFASRGYGREEPAVLQPAEIFLNRSGEEIRRRFTLTDPTGRDLCLRPDLTIPICRQAVQANRAFPARIAYNGLVFRHQPGEPHRPTQFFQAGVELLGLEDAAAGETEILTLAVEALRVCGLKDLSLRIGDLALFGALVDALALPLQWRSRLKRHFWRAGYVEALLYWLSHDGDGAVKLPSTRAEIVALLDARADAPTAGRTRDEIIARAMGRAAEAANLRLDEKVANAIAELLDISGPALEALAKIRALLKSIDINLEPQLAAMDARLVTLKSLGVDLAGVQFTAHFGRNMEYYTGFVFELWARDREGPVQVAGGGRYDSMMEMLGAKKPVSAIGCAIRTERVLAAAGGA